MSQKKLEYKFNNLLSILDNSNLRTYEVQREEVNTLKSSLQQNLKDVSDKDRALRIAIVGQMKAGKSSFLNALLFPLDILPKAATPMTAALTRIAYSETPRIEIEFFSKKDWQGIQNSAQEYVKQYQQIETELKTEIKAKKKPMFGMGMSKIKKASSDKSTKITPALIKSKISAELISCYELVQMAQKNHIDLSDTLGQTKVINGASMEEIAHKMYDYVGSSGKFTAITKILSLYVDDSRLHDIEVFDTPGFNDPVISRGTQTRKFLGQCDMVFLLSTIAQYLTRSDLSLLREQLSSAGIDSKAVHLVGTQKDLVFRMDAELIKQAKILAMKKSQGNNQNKVMIAAMMHLLDKKVAQMTRDNIGSHLADSSIDDITRELLTHLYNEPTSTVSSISWRIAQNLPNLPPSLAEPYQGLVASTQYKFDIEELKSFSSIETLREKLSLQKSKKDKLVSAKVDNLIIGAQAKLENIVTEINNDITIKLSLLEESSIEQLKHKQYLQTTKLISGRQSVEHIIQKALHEKTIQIDEFINHLSRLKSRFGDVEVQSSVEYKIQKTEKDGFWAGVARFFDTGGYDYNQVKIVTQYAQVQDSIEQIEGYSDTVNLELAKIMTGIVDMQQLRKLVLNATVELFDTADPDFDILSFKHEVGRYLRSFRPPKFKPNISDIIDNVISSFSSDVVKTNDIQVLQNKHKQAIKKVTETAIKDAKSAKSNITTYFNDLERTLTVNIIDTLEKNTQEVIKQLEDRERSIDDFNQLKDQLMELDSSLTT